MGQPDLETVPLTTLLDDLASGTPTPGGGTGAALAGALAASLVGMTARVTLLKPKHAQQAKLLDAIAEGADDARARLLRLGVDDARAYRAVVEAQRLPKRTDEETAERQKRLQHALKEATEIPLRVMEQVLEIIGLGKNAVESGLKSTASDGAAGVEIGRAALKAAALAVRANLAGIEDETYVKISRTRLDEMLYMGTRVATHVESFVHDLWS